MTTPSPPRTPPTVVNTPETVGSDTPDETFENDGKVNNLKTPLHRYNLQTPPVKDKHPPTPSTIVEVLYQNNGRSYILYKKNAENNYVPFTTSDNPNNIYYKNKDKFEPYTGATQFLKTVPWAMNLGRDIKAATKSKKRKRSKSKSKSKSKKTKKQKRSKK
tara:strand:- start:1554 stop:2036 length:483 start_codon:yes stop_codon:yes gene_type:complete